MIDISFTDLMLGLMASVTVFTVGAGLLLVLGRLLRAWAGDPLPSIVRPVDLGHQDRPIQLEPHGLAYPNRADESFGDEPQEYESWAPPAPRPPETLEREAS